VVSPALPPRICVCMRRMNLKHGIGNGIAHGSVGRYAMNGNLVI
jgi:hypothetical protein